VFSLILFPCSIFSIYVFQVGYFSDILKIAKIQPTVKKGEQYMKNYRPIWILSVFSKILEKLTLNRLYSFIHQYNILTDAQNVFRWGRSTETTTQSFTSSVLEVLDNHLNAIVTPLYLSKANDVLNHEIVFDISVTVHRIYK